MSDGKVVIEVTADTSSYSSAVGKLGSETKSSLSTAIKGSFIGNLFANAFSSAASTIGSSIDGAISRVDTLNQFPKVMQQMGFSASDAQGSIDKLSSGIEGLPTSLDSIAANTKSIALLTGDLDGATDTAIALNDAFLASGSSTADAERGLTQYTQMLSKGSVDMQSWRTLQETMGYALRETANEMGFTGESATNDLYKALQSGEVTFDEFNAKLVECDQAAGGFGSTAQTASAGIETSMQNAKTAITKNLANIIDEINGDGSISGIFDGLKNGINIAGAAIVEEIPKIKEAFGQIAQDFAPALETLKGAVEQVAPLIKGAFDGLIQSLPQLVPVIAGVAAAFGAFQAMTFLSSIPGIITGISTAMGALNMVMAANPIGVVVTLLAALVAALITAYNTNEDFRNAVNAAWETVSSVVGGAIQGLVEFFQNFDQNLVNAFNDAVSAGSDFINNIGNAIASLPSTLAGFLSAGIAKVVSFATSMATNARNAGTRFLSGIVNGIRSVPGRVASFLSNTVGKAGSFASSFAAKAANAARNFASKITSGLAGLPGKMVSVGGQIIQGIVSGLNPAAITARMKEIASGALSTVKSFLGIHSPSRVMRDQVGKMISAGVAKGIAADASLAAKAAANMAGDVVTAAEGNTATIPLGFDLQRAAGALDSVSTVDILGESVMQAAEGITTRLDTVISKLEAIANRKSGEQRAVTVNLNYSNNSDANTMANELARKLRSLELLGA